MKKPIIVALSLAFTLIATSAFVTKNSSGIAGYTGSPGELSCSGGGACHGGGSSAAQGVTITATPSFTADQYMADSTYLINIQVAATGFNRYGFGCEILDSLNVNAGTMQLQGSGVKLINSGNGRRNATHTTPRVGTGGTTFTFKWVAPSEGRVNFYTVCNAVNGNGTTSGDLPISGYLAVYPAPLPPQDTISDTVGIYENLQGYLSGFKVFPNPIRDYANVSYHLKETAHISVDLITLNGTVIKELYSAEQNPGSYDQFVKMPDLVSGAYFVRISINDKKVSQKLVTVF